APPVPVPFTKEEEERAKRFQAGISKAVKAEDKDEKKRDKKDKKKGKKEKDASSEDDDKKDKKKGKKEKDKKEKKEEKEEEKEDKDEKKDKKAKKDKKSKGDEPEKAKQGKDDDAMDVDSGAIKEEVPPAAKEDKEDGEKKEKEGKDKEKDKKDKKSKDKKKKKAASSSSSEEAADSSSGETEMEEEAVSVVWPFMMIGIGAVSRAAASTVDGADDVLHVATDCHVDSAVAVVAGILPLSDKGVKHFAASYVNTASTDCSFAGRASGTFNTLDSLPSVLESDDEGIDSSESTHVTASVLPDDENSTELRAESCQGTAAVPSLFDSVRCHPIHIDAPGTDSVSYKIAVPVRIGGCRTSQQMADAVAGGFPISEEDLVTHALHDFVDDKLILVSEHCLLTVLLGFSEVATAPASSADGISVVAVVPWVKAGTSPESLDVEGWLLACPTESVGVFLEKLGSCGAMRSGLRDDYCFEQGDNSIGGGCSTVFIARKARTECEMVAVKVIRDTVSAACVHQEVHMLREAQSHPCVIRLLDMRADEIGQSGKQWSLVFDHYRRGDLYDEIMNRGAMKEQLAWKMMKSLFSALDHLKGRGIFHRDIKPENVLLSNETLQFVLTDFGNAVHVSDQQGMASRAGTVSYASPEMITGTAIGCEGDAFGAGVLLYFVLSKATPFYSKLGGMTAIEENTLKCRVPMHYPAFEALSADCRQLLLDLICKDPTRRLTPNKALARC
ncbi:unnamed protein product, partial [Polarella glacialis]